MQLTFYINIYTVLKDFLYIVHPVAQLADKTTQTHFQTEAKEKWTEINKYFKLQKLLPPYRIDENSFKHTAHFLSG